MFQNLGSLSCHFLITRDTRIAPVEAAETFNLTVVTYSSFASLQNSGNNCKVSVYFVLKSGASLVSEVSLLFHMVSLTVVMVMGADLLTQLQNLA